MSAVVRAAALPEGGVPGDFAAFLTTLPAAESLEAAAALHTEVAVRSRTADPGAPWANRHLDIAAAIVEIGTPPKLNRLGSPDLRKSTLPPVTGAFRRQWFVATITWLENGGRIDVARAYLEKARILFPHDADILLLSGIGEEMRASNRLTTASAGDRRRSLGYAEVYLRASLELAPDRLESKLRLGRVLSQRDHPAEARTLLAAVSASSDARLSYLALLFLGGLEEEAGDTAAAAKWYARAGARTPAAQSARLAGSELRHRAGERQEAAAAIASAIGASNSGDPWWGYLFGEYWKTEQYLDGLRRMGRS